MPKRKFRIVYDWSWAGATVLVLAVCLGVGWAVSIIMSSSSRTPPIDGAVADLLSTIGGVLAGAITAFMGAQIGARRRERDDRLDSAEEEEAEDDDDSPPLDKQNG